MGLGLDEQETTFSQTAEERRRGVWHVYSDASYWQRRLDEHGRLLKVEYGGGKHYEIEHRQITLRRPGKMAVSGGFARRKVSGAIESPTGAETAVSSGVADARTDTEQ